jgi:two-component system sensor histidine kinase YesM
MSLEEELAFFKYYFELENMRLDQAVALEIIHGKDIDPEDLRVPPLITQPILENAFKHAFAEGQPGILRLETAWSPEQNLVLTITSIGMPWTEKKSTGMGLSLVQQRLEKVYGKGKQPWISWKKMAPNQFKVYLTFPQL